MGIYQHDVDMAQDATERLAGVGLPANVGHVVQLGPLGNHRRRFLVVLRPRGGTRQCLHQPVELVDRAQHAAPDDARVVFGGISGRPYRETAVEAFLKGKTLNSELGDQAVAVALSNAAPLKYNATKIDMAKGLLASGLTRLNA